MENAIDINMIYCRLRELIAEKERNERRKITYKVIMDEAHISSATIAKLTNFEGIKRIDASTIENLCKFFNCTVGDLLVYEPTSMRFIQSSWNKVDKVSPENIPDSSDSEDSVDNINNLRSFDMDIDKE